MDGILHRKKKYIYILDTEKKNRPKKIIFFGRGGLIY